MIYKSRSLNVLMFISLAIVLGLGLKIFWKTADSEMSTETHKDHTHHKELWTCSMHPQVIQDQPGVCPICHMQLVPLKVENQIQEKKIKYWWDPMMSPPFISKNPGKSPMGMDLIPVYEEKTVSAGGLVSIDPVVVQNMGVHTAIVKEDSINRTLRLYGTVIEAEPNIHDVNLLVSGWVRKLYADTVGMFVKEGDPLFEIYSPELQVAVQELITSQKTKNLQQNIQKKLLLLGLEKNQIEKLSMLPVAPETVVFFSPISGHVTEKMIVEGSAIKAGEKVFRLVNHSKLWIETQVFEEQLALVKLGQLVKATMVAFPGEIFEGKIMFIHPHVDMITRGTKVRIEIANQSLKIKPGMYATVEIKTEVINQGLIVPREAIIDSGESQITFVSLGQGKFEPREVKLGQAGDQGMVQVLSGVKVGEVVVTSGQFLLDSESRLKEAVQKFVEGN